MEFNAYKSGSSKNNFSFNFKLPNLKNLSKQYVILLGVIIFFVASAGIYLVYNKTLSTKEHAGYYENCRQLCYAQMQAHDNKYKKYCQTNNKIKIKPDFCYQEPFDLQSCLNKCIEEAKNKKIIEEEGCSKDFDCYEKIRCDPRKERYACINNNCICKPKPISTPTPSPTLQTTPKPTETIVSSCQNKPNGTQCGKNPNDICINDKCINNVYITTSKAECNQLGGQAIRISNNKYYCTNCQNRPIIQKQGLNCKPPQCTGSKACVSPGTTSPGTDCNWYICDTKGSGLWIKTNRSCTQPAPTTTTNNSTPTPTPTPSTTATPTPTPTSTTDQTATITITHIQAGQCTDLGYSANYTIKLTYGPEQATQTINYNLTVNLDNNIDPAWVNDVSNNGSVDANTKTINWQQASLDPNNNQATYTYKINFPTSALNQTFNNTAIVSYNSTQEQSLATTTTSCSNTNDTTPTITPTTTPVPNTGIFDNITLTGGILSTIVIGLLIGL